MLIGQKLVLEFHQTFEATIATEPTLPSSKDEDLRINLINEESFEFRRDGHEVVGAVDALGDLVYVAFGAAITYGFYFDSFLTEDVKVPIAGTPQIPAERQRLVALIAQRAAAFEVAAREKNLDAVKIALNNLLHMAYRASVAYGVRLDSIVAEIHRSNMTKLWSKDDVDQMTNEEKETLEVIKNVGDKFLVTRKSDKKVAKPRSYSPASLQPLVARLNASHFVVISEGKN